MFTVTRVQLLALSLTWISVESGASMTRSELREKFGQAHTAFNDGRSCNRMCNGTKMTCYYEFDIQMFDTMSGACRDCKNGAIEDCFRKDCIVGNGVKRTMMTINHLLPGPPINICKDDRVIIDVTNHMDGQALTIHWHGLFQKDTPWMDGVPMVTQCPIVSGNTFRYDFHVPQSGSQLYHAHSGVHRVNGITGIFNIRDVYDPNADYYDYDLPEHTVFLMDWSNLLAEEKTPGASAKLSFPDSVLINGLGSFFDPNLGKFAFAPMATFYVERGKKHRFRLVNGRAFNCQSDFSVKNHKLTVIATDGYSIEPVVVDSVISTPGERFDVVIDATKDMNINETLMTIRLLGPCHDVARTQGFARIKFVDNINNFSKKFEDQEPLKERPAFESLDVPKITLNDHLRDCTDSDNYCIAALQQKQLSDSVGGNLRNELAEVISLKFRLQFGLDRSGTFITVKDDVMVGMMNGISYEMAQVPSLTQDDSHVPYCNADNKPESCNGEPICHCSHLIELEHCQVYELMVRDDRGLKGRDCAMTHPLHFHGYAFQVIDIGTIDQYENGRGYFANATHLPVVKDTVSIPCAGFVRLRFRACNPGYWLIHCHYEFHAHSGLRAVIKVGDRKDMPPPPSNFPKCDNFLSSVDEFELDRSAGNSIHYESIKFSIFIFCAICFYEVIVISILIRFSFN